MRDISSESQSGKIYRVFFFTLVPSIDRTTWVAMLGVPISKGQGKYLGLLNMIGRSNKEAFCYIGDRVWKKTRR